MPRRASTSAKAEKAAGPGLFHTFLRAYDNVVACALHHALQFESIKTKPEGRTVAQRLQWLIDSQRCAVQVVHSFWRRQLGQAGLQETGIHDFDADWGCLPGGDHLLNTEYTEGAVLNRAKLSGGN